MIPFGVFFVMVISISVILWKPSVKDNNGDTSASRPGIR